MTGGRLAPDANRLAAELADVVWAQLERRGLSVAAACRELPVSEATVNNLLNGHGVGLDTLTTLARWAGYDVALIRRGEP